MPKWPINKFKQVHSKADNWCLRAYCPNIYTGQYDALFDLLHKYFTCCYYTEVPQHLCMYLTLKVWVEVVGTSLFEVAFEKKILD